MEYAHGYIDPEEYKNDPPLYNILPKYNELQHLRDYCFEHASDSANPVQDFIDKGLISPAPEYEDCKTVKSNLEIIDVQTAELLRTYPDRHNGELVPPEWDWNKMNKQMITKQSFILTVIAIAVFIARQIVNGQTDTNANSVNIQGIPTKKVHVGDIDIAHKN